MDYFAAPAGWRMLLNFCQSFDCVDRYSATLG
jgi:hypothetical protein